MFIKYDEKMQHRIECIKQNKNRKSKNLDYEKKNPDYEKNQDYEKEKWGNSI